MNEKYYVHWFQNTEGVGFFSNSLSQISECHLPKKVNPNLQKVLLNPVKNSLQYSFSKKKIFIGFSTLFPFSTKRAPIWIDPKAFFQMILIGGSIGSGKTTLVNRLLAGALNCGMTVAIGEAKGGLEVMPERTAFSLLAKYLAKRLNVNNYRWPRGNCWFNPLLYLNSASDRQTFMSAIAKQTSADNLQFVDRAASIAALVLEYLEASLVDVKHRSKRCTLEQVVKYLDPKEFINYSRKVESKYEDRIKDSNVNSKKIELYKSKLKQLKAIKQKFKRLGFLELATAKVADRLNSAQGGGIKDFTDILQDEDLLYYTAEHETDREGNPLIQLKLEEIVYELSLVVVSQPLASNSPSANIVGPIFWESLLSYVRKLGLSPEKKDGKSRKDIVAFLDETHRLPVGNLGDSGDTLREYKIGLVEILPSIGDRVRWERNKHVYQTIFSSSPGVKEVYELMHERLPEYIRPRFEVGFDLQLNDGRVSVAPRVSDNQNNIAPQGDPGVSIRALADTGNYTTLMHSRSVHINDSNGLFWIDLESPLLAKLQLLLQEAVNGDVVSGRLADYALGLVQEFDKG